MADKKTYYYDLSLIEDNGSFYGYTHDKINIWDFYEEFVKEKPIKSRPSVMPVEEFGRWLVKNKGFTEIKMEVM